MKKKISELLHTWQLGATETNDAMELFVYEKHFNWLLNKEWLLKNDEDWFYPHLNVNSITRHRSGKQHSSL